MVKLNEIKNEDIEKRKEEVLPNLLDQILLICKEDENFKISKKIENYDKVIESSKRKLNHKKELLDQAKEIENKILKELNQLEEENTYKRNNLLSELGSEFDD
ncbi:MAG: hypothetical protein K9L74_07725 [Candidatus Izimaplasma sp.]|nr:hypothetical protein [Candidatus Izimaplasma bacterium]